MKVQRTSQRPTGSSISYSQLSQGCGGKLKFKRQKVKDKDVGIFLLYGRALHAGLEARAKGRARSDVEAVKLAILSLRHSLSHERLPVSWDEPWETLKDGSISADSYGNLCTPEVCEWWLERQVPLYLEHYPDQQVVRSEHRIFVPLTPPPGASWSRPWSLECWLDREMKDGSIHDIKSAGSPWSERDIRKHRAQALTYMGAYYSFYHRRPAYFEFHVLPRQRDRAEVQVVRHEWDAKAIQAYVDSVAKPQVTVIENDAYVFNPGNSLCTPKYCNYWDWCAFGAGENL